jgi:hypothetical protein
MYWLFNANQLPVMGYRISFHTNIQKSSELFMDIYTPLNLLSRELLQQFIDSGHRYFIRQEMMGGKKYFIEFMKSVLVLTHYKNKMDAMHHLESLGGFGKAKLYDKENDEDLSNLYKMAEQPDQYRIFSSYLNLTSWIPPKDFQGKLFDYLKSRNYTKVEMDRITGVPVVVHGMIWLDIKFSQGSVRVPFHDVAR